MTRIFLFAALAASVGCSGRRECDDHGVDSDRDGVLACDDCDDEDPAVHPDQFECCGSINDPEDRYCNDVDDDCDGEVDEAPNECDQDG